jgi:hypothetical protein
MRQRRLKEDIECAGSEISGANLWLSCKVWYQTPSKSQTLLPKCICSNAVRMLCASDDRTPIFHLQPPLGGDHALLPFLVVGLVGDPAVESVPE